MTGMSRCAGDGSKRCGRSRRAARAVERSASQSSIDRTDLRGGDRHERHSQRRQARFPERGGGAGGGLRRNDYDLYGSSLTYTLARALVVDYVGPLWSKGSLLLVRKDSAAKFKTLADFNDPKVTFSVVAGGSEEPRIPILFPKAKLITTAGQVVLGAEPVRAKKADVWMSGDSDVLLFAKRNPTWAHVFDTDHPIDKRPNTWAVRYGDSEWKHFLDFFAVFLTVNGEMERLFKLHMEKLGAA